MKAYSVIGPLGLITVPVVMVVCAVLRIQHMALLTTLVAIAALVPFFRRYENEKLRPRDIMPVVVLAAIAAIGRVIFEPFPNFKPVSAMVIVAGVTFGKHNGFMCGALAALTSNMFFGQGIWTPWQMYAWGMMGYGAGLLQQTRLFHHVAGVYVYGAAASLLFGIIMDSYFLLGYLDSLPPAAILAAYAAGLPFNAIHMASTVIFLAVTLLPWGKKLNRLKTKYGIVTR